MSPFAQSDGMLATADGRFREKPTRERPSQIGCSCEPHSRMVSRRHQSTGQASVPKRHIWDTAISTRHWSTSRSPRNYCKKQTNDSGRSGHIACTPQKECRYEVLRPVSETVACLLLQVAGRAAKCLRAHRPVISRHLMNSSTLSIIVVVSAKPLDPVVLDLEGNLRPSNAIRRRF
jgi:hypothetical protein